MKKLSLFIILATLGTLLFNSCSVERRYHRKGLNVNWNNTSVKIKKDRNHNNSNVELIDENWTEDYNTNRENESNVITYSDLKDNSVAVNSEELVLTHEKKQLETTTNASIKHDVNYSSSATSATKQEIGKSTLKFKKRIGKGEEVKVLHPQKSGIDDDDLVLCIVLAFFIPPLAVYLFEGSWTNRCTVNLILTLLCGLPGVIHALVVILSGK